jgi:hypothetical protein
MIERFMAVFLDGPLKDRFRHFDWDGSRFPREMHALPSTKPPVTFVPQGLPVATAPESPTIYYLIEVLPSEVGVYSVKSPACRSFIGPCQCKGKS